MKNSLKILVNELRGIIYSTDFAKSNFTNQGKNLTENQMQIINEFENDISGLYDKEVEILEKINLKIDEIEDDVRGVA